MIFSGKGKVKIPKKLTYSGLFLMLSFTFVVCVSAGSVDIPLYDTVRILISKVFKVPGDANIPENFTLIIYGIRLPRVMLAALTGAALSISGCAMQGLLRNPLADSSTLGVATFAALGAVIAIASGLYFPFLPQLGICITGVIFAFASFLLILTLSYKIDPNLSTNTIILNGIIISMFASSIISFIISMSKKQMENIIFWTMGSFSGRGWKYVALSLPVFVVGTVGLMGYAKELNAFALGEEKAGYIGVDTKKIKLRIMFFVSLLVGMSVSISGTIAFVGLVIPHITRMLSGPNHKKLMPLSMVIGACFMMLTDLFSRTVIRPSELPLGVVTSLIGSVIFIFIFYSQRQKTKAR